MSQSQSSINSSLLDDEAFWSSLSAGSTATSTQLAKTFGRYELMEPLGSGGFAHVFRAVHREDNYECAVKILHPARQANPRDVAKFEREAKIASRLVHPNIVRIRDTGVTDEHHWHEMPFIRGTNLYDVTNVGPEGIHVTLGWMLQLAQALAYLHKNDVLHRDLKPSNIMIERESKRPMIIDFGLAKAPEGVPAIDKPRDVVGTEPYMAPEQAAPRFDEFTPATDVYGLGATLYHLLTQRPPFPVSKRTWWDIVYQIRNVTPPAPSRFNPSVPPDLDRLCLICLEKNPLDRYGFADELAAELQRLIRGQRIHGQRPGRAKRLLRSCQRHPRTTISMLGLFAAFSASAVGMRYFAHESASKDTRVESANRAASQAVLESADAVYRRRFQTYVSEMKEAGSLWESGKTDLVRKLVDRHATESKDLLGVEWHYWAHRLANTGSKFDQRLFQSSSIAISTDEKSVAVANYAQLAVYDMRTKKQLYTRYIGSPEFRGVPDQQPTAWGQRVAISRFSKYVAAVTIDPTVPGRAAALRVWQLADGQEVLKVAQSRWISGDTVVFSPDNLYVIAGGYSNEFYAWPLDNQRGDSILHGSEREVSPITTDYSPTDGSGGRGPRVIDLRFDADTLVISSGISAIPTHPPVLGVVSGHYHGPRLWDWALQKPRPLPREFRPDGWLVPPFNEGERLVSMKGGHFRVTGAAGSAGGKNGLATTGPTCTAIAFGRQMTVTGHDDSIVRTWTIDPNGPAPRLLNEYRGLSGIPVCVAIGHSKIVAVDGSGNIRTWELDKQNESKIMFPVIPEELAYHSKKHKNSTGTLTATQAAAGDDLLVSDPSGLNKAAIQAPGKNWEILAVCFSADEKYIAAEFRPKVTRANYLRVEWQNRLIVWHVERGRIATAADGRNDYVRGSVSFSADSKLLSLGLRSRGMQVLNLADGKAISTCELPDLRFALLSPSGRYLTVGGYPRSGVWSVTEHRWLCSVENQVHGGLFVQGGFELKTPSATAFEETRALLIGNPAVWVELPSGTVLPTLLGVVSDTRVEVAADRHRIYSLIQGRLHVYAILADDGVLLLDVPADTPARDMTIEAALAEVQGTWADALARD